MWRFALAQATGTSHLKVGLACQDRLACVVLPSGILVAVVADGAGSAASGDVGAEIAVSATLAHITMGLEGQDADLNCVLHHAAAQAREAVLSVAADQRAEARSYASTLLAVVITEDSAAAMQIGDGVIVVSEGSDEWNWMFWPQRGEYANTTHFLTDDDALHRIDIDTYVGALTDVALMSDGLEPLALHYASKTAHDPFFEGVFRPLHESTGETELPGVSSMLDAFLVSDRVRARTDDDMSLILATCRSRNANNE